MARQLREACAISWLAEAQALWDSGDLTLADVRDIDNYAFRYACANGRLAVAQWLWGLRDFTGEGLTLADVRALDNKAFRWTCERGHLAVAQWLWGLRDAANKRLTLADVQSCDNEALRAAHARGHQAVTQWLRELGVLERAEPFSVVSEKDATCPICLDAPEDAIVANGHDVRHGACRLCLESWLAKNSTCPVCRAAL